MVAVLREQGLLVFGRRDDTIEQHRANVASVLDAGPDHFLQVRIRHGRC